MRTSLDCIPCFAKQTLEAVRFVSDDPSLHEYVLREVLATASRMDLSASPPVMGREIHRRIAALTGIADPYREVKQRSNRMALSMLPQITEQVAAAQDPLLAAVRFAIAGNVIDVGVPGHDMDSARHSIWDALSEPFFGDVEAFRIAVGAAERVLYIADNAGEIVFDRLLLERMTDKTVHVAVRSGPILNDVTYEDAEAACIHHLAEIVDSGCDLPGTVLAEASEGFLRLYHAADVIIAKGQGNFETLSDEAANIFFLLKAKCPVVAEHVGVAVGTHVLRRGVGATQAFESLAPTV